MLDNGCDYLSILGLKLNHVSKRGHLCHAVYLQERCSWWGISAIWRKYRNEMNIINDELLLLERLSSSIPPTKRNALDLLSIDQSVLCTNCTFKCSSSNSSSLFIVIDWWFLSIFLLGHQQKLVTGESHLAKWIGLTSWFVHCTIKG